MRVGVLLSTLVFGGCAAVSPEWRGDATGIEVPGSWSASKEAQAGVDGDWIRTFSDKRLTALVDEAMANNPDLRVAATRLDIARSNVTIAGAAGRPRMDAVFNGRRQKQNFSGSPTAGGGNQGTATPGGGGVDPVTGEPIDVESSMEDVESDEVISSLTNQFGVSLDVSWEVDVWGRIRAGQSAAIGQYQAAEADLWAAETSLAAQVAKSYFALAEADEQLSLALATVKSFKETEETIRDRFELGQNEEGSLGTQLRLAMSDVALAEADVAARQEARAVAVRQLETLLGRYPKGVEKGRLTLPDVPRQPPAGLPSELLKRRPDVLAAERRYAAQGKRVKEGKLALFPQLKLTGSAGTSAEDLDQLLNSDFGVWSLAGNAVQPILTGGQLRAQINVRETEERAALAELQSTVLKAFSEVEIALASDAYLARRESALRRAVELSQEASEQARIDYRGASGGFLTVLTAQVSELRSKGNLLTVRRLRLDNRVNLHLALGGDFKVRDRR